MKKIRKNDRKSEIELIIFNTHGKEVATPVCDRLAIGKYKYEWDVSNLPCGVYLYRLKAEGIVETRKMILMK